MDVEIHSDSDATKAEAIVRTKDGTKMMTIAQAEISRTHQYTVTKEFRLSFCKKNSIFFENIVRRLITDRLFLCYFPSFKRFDACQSRIEAVQHMFKAEVPKKMVELWSSFEFCDVMSIAPLEKMIRI